MCSGGVLACQLRDGHVQREARVQHGEGHRGQAGAGRKRPRVGIVPHVIVKAREWVAVSLEIEQTPALLFWLAARFSSGRRAPELWPKVFLRVTWLTSCFEFVDPFCLSALKSRSSQRACISVSFCVHHHLGASFTVGNSMFENRSQGFDLCSVCSPCPAGG